MNSLIRLEKAMAPHSSTLAWTIPWTEEPDRQQSMGVAQSRTRLSDFTFTFHFHALEKEMATRSSVLAWRIPWTDKPGRLQSMGVAQSRTRLKQLSSSSSKQLQNSQRNASDSVFPKASNSYMYLATLLEQQCNEVKITQSCLTLCDSMYCSPSGTSVHGILQARNMAWVAYPFSRRSSQPRAQTQVSHIAGRFFTI